MKKNKNYDAVRRIYISVSQIKGELGITSSLSERTTLNERLKNLKNELKKIVKGA